ncbi:hypothetical protein AK95_18685 [Paenibacillus sp. LC231]|uniref:hypothetical protein n=1 Tax=Paenibacillus sp. LC231 TaxID=1120679 RepID=UPI0008DD87CD|nr:hypothetical protein [Paenibacillus sp. LC231]OIA99204.1 hypothetical protein AK95_18685 [Paenibacillus sp. LC231]
MGWMIGMMTGAVLVLLAVVWFRRKKRSGRERNVIHLNTTTRTRSGQHGQACSKCRRKRQLIFYADDAGAVRGLCTDCKRELERHQELYPV